MRTTTTITSSSSSPGRPLTAAHPPRFDQEAKAEAEEARSNVASKVAPGAAVRKEGEKEEEPCQIKMDEGDETEDDPDGEDREDSKILTQHFYIGEQAVMKTVSSGGRAGGQRSHRSLSVPNGRIADVSKRRLSTPATSTKHQVDSDAAGDCEEGEEVGESPEELELLWSLFDAQQALAQEDKMVKQALEAHQELVALCEEKRREIKDLQAQLQDTGALSEHSLHFAPPLREEQENAAHSSRNEDADDPELLLEIESLKGSNEALCDAIKEADIRLNQRTSPFVGHGAGAGTQLSGAEAIECELQTLRHRESKAVEGHPRKLEILREELEGVGSKSQESRGSLRRELSDICTEREFLEAELEGVLHARPLALERLRSEEQRLLEALEELRSRAEQQPPRSLLLQNGDEDDGMDKASETPTTLEQRHASQCSASSRSSLSTLGTGNAGDMASGDGAQEGSPALGYERSRSSLFQELTEPAERRRVLRATRARGSRASFRTLPGPLRLAATTGTEGGAKATSSDAPRRLSVIGETAPKESGKSALAARIDEDVGGGNSAGDGDEEMPSPSLPWGGRRDSKASCSSSSTFDVAIARHRCDDEETGPGSQLSAAAACVDSILKCMASQHETEEGEDSQEAMKATAESLLAQHLSKLSSMAQRDDRLAALVGSVENLSPQAPLAATSEAKQAAEESSTCPKDAGEAEREVGKLEKAEGDDAEDNSSFPSEEAMAELKRQIIEEQDRMLQELQRSALQRGVSFRQVRGRSFRELQELVSTMETQAEQSDEVDGTFGV